MSSTPGSALAALRQLATSVGVATAYTDGHGRRVRVGAETLMAVCNALGTDLARPEAAVGELRRLEAEMVSTPPVIVAWDGKLRLADRRLPSGVMAGGGEVTLDDGTTIPVEPTDRSAGGPDPLPLGKHCLRWERGADMVSLPVIAAPKTTWQRAAGSGARWGVGLQLAALRSERGPAMGTLTDLDELCRWLAAEGADLVTLLPLLPTFNDPPAEPSPYSPVSRLFWSELLLDPGRRRRPPTDPAALTDFPQAMADVRAELAARLDPDDRRPADSIVDPELARYAAFRGAQARLGRNWRAWPAAATAGNLAPTHIDPTEERFHLTAQSAVRERLGATRGSLDELQLGLGLDVAIGVHPHGYDPWSRQELFAPGMVVGAPPDPGFPNGQSWGFSPILPEASRRDGHSYLAASLAHQAAVADVLRIDHVMGLHRLYWIPDGMDLDEGTYVRYPTDENFAILCLESHRNRCEIVGENLGVVPPEIDSALPRHDIRGMYLAQFAAGSAAPIPRPTSDEVAMIGTHDTPPLAGWLQGVDIGERIRLGLMPAAGEQAERAERAAAANRLAAAVGGSVDKPHELLTLLLDWIGRSASPLVTVWLEDLWLESAPVNVPGSSSAERPNWQRPVELTLEELTTDPAIGGLLRRLRKARQHAP